MGTRALIAYQNSRTIYEVNLLNYDGYPEHMKEVLPTVDTLKKVKEIKAENNQILRFEPIFGQKCNDLVYKECNGVIYHITDDRFIDKIRKKGLISFRNSNYRNFSDRVFFSCGKNKKEIIDNLKNVIKQLEKINYHILKIDLNKYKYNVDFYFDPSEDDKHNYIYANAYFYPHMIEEIKDLETLINENYKEVILPNGQQIKLQIL